MATQKDYYEVLGVSKNATEAQLKAAYRQQALQWHPDKNKAPEAEAKFKEINEAYEILSDKEKRTAYDQFGHSAFEPGAGFGGAYGPFSGQSKTYRQGPFNYTYTTYGGGEGPDIGFDFGGFSDPFDIFAQFFGGASPFGAGRASRKPRYGISLTFMEAAKGTEKEASVEGKKRKIKIPAGVDDGTVINFNDFYLSVDVQPDKTFRREGLDVYVEKEISFSQAALGAVISVPTIEGQVNLRVRPGTQPGTLVRLKGKGIRSPRSGGVGDQYVRLQVVVPTRLSRQQKEALEKFEV
jgi:DnaJ-class molecular chaperone